MSESRNVFQTDVETCSEPLGESLTSALEALSRQESVGLPLVVLAGFEAILYRYTGRDRIVIDVDVPGTTPGPQGPSGRERGSPAQSWGDAIAIVADMSGDPSFRQLVARTREPAERIDCRPRLEELVANLEGERNLSNLPLNRVAFCGQRRDQRESNEPPPEFRADLRLTVLEDTQDGLRACLDYRKDRFESASVSRMLAHLRTLLEATVAEPEQPVSALPLVTSSELVQLVHDWNRTDAEYPQLCLHEWIGAQVKRRPDAAAISSEGGEWSYRELNDRANQLAHFLRGRGVGPEVLVAICVERSMEMLVALLGVLKAGGAYVPLDPAYPKERLAYMLQDSAAPVVLTQSVVAKAVPAGPAERVLLDADWDVIARESRETPASGATPMNLAYVIYTSGSTGKPKGVLVTHGSLVNLLASMACRPGMTAEDVLLAVTTLSFDIAGLELYLPLVTGGRVVLASRSVTADGVLLAEKLAKSGATIMQATPATWRMLITNGWAGDPRLKILCGGEALPSQLARALRERGGSVWNLYGPTETTIWSAVHCVGDETGPVPIGCPIANTQMYVLDSRLRPLPIGVAGELYIGGAGVARGYRHLPELTEKKFISDPFRIASNARLYRTGDLARFRPDGEIEFLGRLDDQVKVRGFRIELGEIEAALARHPSIRAAAVAVREDMPGEKQLVAYLVPSPEGLPKNAELRVFLKERLPEYMVPTAFCKLEALPLTPNGKLDRQALPAPDTARREIQNEFVAPRSEMEKRLARIWEKALGIAPIGLRDDFFDLGGHSLVAARMFAEIQKSFRKNLSPARLLQAPTIEQLAVLLRGEEEVWRSSSLVPIQPVGSQIPLFCIHAGAGTILFYYDLARELGSDQPVYGLQAQGLYGEFPPHSTVEEMARHYIRELRTIRPRGPYALAGFCFGAILAFEMAQQLQEQGQDVNLLVSLDGPAPRYDYSADRTFSPPKSLKFRISEQWAHFVRLGPREKASYVLEKLRNQWIQLTINAQFAQYRIGEFCRLRGRPVPEKIRRFYFLINNSEAERKYVPRVYPGRMVVFSSEGVFHDPNLGWEGLVSGGLQSYSVPGEHQFHRDLMTGAFIEVVSERLRTYLNPAKDRHEAASRTA